MFVALKNWREHLKHRGGASGDRLLAQTERALARERGSDELLRQFRAAALVPSGAAAGARPRGTLGELGRQFEGAEPLTARQNLSIMAEVQRGAARQKRRT